MRKFLVISNDLERSGAPVGPHQFKREHEEKLQACAPDVELIVASPDESLEHLAEAEMVAGFPLRIPTLVQAPAVKWLHSFSAGVDRFLTPDVIESNIIVSNSSGVHATPIAEHILATMLMFVRGSHRALRRQLRHEWEKDESVRELRGANVLIVGAGEIGMETARLSAAFGAHVWTITRTKREMPEFIERNGTSDELDTLLPDADFIVITLPHTPDTHHLFDTSKFERMKRSAILINIGRGQIVDEKDLVDALQKGTIAGAGLDVFEKEPLPENSPLWNMDNVIITPHHSGLSHRYMDRAIDILCKNIQAYLKGDPSTKLRTGLLPNVVDKQLGY